MLPHGHHVRALTRSPAKLRDYPWIDDVEVVGADLLDPSTLDGAIDGADAVYYLAHSMEVGDDFAETELEAATNLAAAAERTQVGRIVYLGGLGEGELSEHLQSRQDVGRALGSGAVPVVELRAAVIIGSGSLSFEMLRYLTEVLPIMTTPTWVQTRCQPIGIRTVLEALVASLTVEVHGHRIIEIGGPDVLTYEQMMQVYADLAGLRRRIIVRVPVLSPGLSSRWVGVVTPLTNDVAKHLVESLRTEVIVRDPTPMQELGLDPMPFREAVERALGRIADLNVPTRWSATGWNPAQPLPSDPDYAYGTLLTDRRHATTDASPAEVFKAFSRIGGEVGYYRFNWAWSIRGWLDSLVGGVGLRRGRRHPELVRVGESVDFWRVQDVETDRRLLLHAEMKLPGEAWLEWSIDEDAGRSRLTQTAYFVPRGLWGRIYWYAVAPFHVFIFPKMAKAIVEAAENRQPATA